MRNERWGRIHELRGWFAAEWKRAHSERDICRWDDFPASEPDEHADEMLEYREKLAAMSEDELSREWLYRVRNLESHLFFSHYRANANFQTWIRAEYWTADEAAALFFGKEPSLVNTETLYADPEAAKSFFARWFADRKMLIERGLGTKELNPTKVLEWADWNEVPYPNELNNARRVYANKEERATSSSALSSKSEGSYLRIIEALRRELNLLNKHSDAKIIDDMVDAHGDKTGISKSNLEKIFAKAKKVFEE